MSLASHKALIKEIVKLQQNPPEDIRLQLIEEDNYQEFFAFIKGPEDTPFSGGYFKVKVFVTNDYPQIPPKCSFSTKIFHPNVSPLSGEICVSTLKKDWKKEFGLEHILLTIRCLLIAPNAESALNEEAGKLLLEAYDEYYKRASLMTKIHSMSMPEEFLQPKVTEKADIKMAKKHESVGSEENEELNSNIEKSATLESKKRQSAADTTKKRVPDAKKKRNLKRL